jgi:hypothetical protein
MRRRFFLQMLLMPALVFIRPRAITPVDSPLRAMLVYSDSDGRSDAALQALHDDDPTTGINYGA